MNVWVFITTTNEYVYNYQYTISFLYYLIQDLKYDFTSLKPDFQESITESDKKIWK